MCRQMSSVYPLTKCYKIDSCHSGSGLWQSKSINSKNFYHPFSIVWPCSRTLIFSDNYDRKIWLNPFSETTFQCFPKHWFCFNIESNHMSHTGYACWPCPPTFGRFINGAPMSVCNTLGEGPSGRTLAVEGSSQGSVLPCAHTCQMWRHLEVWPANKSANNVTSWEGPASLSHIQQIYELCCPSS